MANYVKFLRGSPIAFKQLKEANQLNDDTLYFIYEKDATDGDLYLGSKLIAGSEALSSLSDIEISSEGLTDNQVLAYDAGSGKWVNMTLEKAITDIFVGATEHSSGVAGLVPAPDKGNIDSFLRSDGSWVAIDKMDIYQGNGIEITEENDKRIIGVKIADTDTHLISDENGLSINLDEYALNSEAKANNGIRYINQIEIDKLNKLVIEDGDITVSGSIEAAQVKNLYTVVENIITGTSVTEDLDPDTEGIQPAFRIEKGAEVNKINSVSNEFSISNTRVLSLNSIPQSKVIGLSDDIAKINKNVQALDKILNGYTDGSSGVESIGLVARVANLEEMATSYVTITDFNSVVGDLAQMKNNNINIMNDIDALQQALTWNSLDTII